MRLTFLRLSDSACALAVVIEQDADILWYLAFYLLVQLSGHRIVVAVPNEIVPVCRVKIAHGNLDFHTSDDGIERIQMIRLVEVAPSLGTVLPAKIYRRNILDAGCLFCFLLNRGKRSTRIRFDKRGQFAGPIFGFGGKAFLNPDEIDQSGFDRPAFYRHF